MNRHQRRANAKSKASLSDPSANELAFSAAHPSPPSAEKPKLMIRFFASILLSKWILRRVRHPEAVRLLISLAQEAGRTEITKVLAARL